ncbi:hypothetical protein [Variovorax ginsengisoli]|uniref:Uncharacterized protein n=1 Tax=Variovorax ginsengisoli TaxID=363844 RepID=A0ABT8SHP7_9BURK|nr:hypothetical protein [Variovorax ginsengisoli]MDN8617881.1 hypothetical protein [Variovorax ginsengisoli]MDO1537051.1 hypothetical protein [Variovorax ginsengisoli]
MALPPLKTAISDTYPNPSNATARAGFASLYDYVVSIPHGQCRLVKSGGNLVLQRYNGQWLRINDVAYSIPSAGVSLAATSLTPGTLYYIYAWMNGATMTLEASVTGHSTDSTTGVEIKTGDVTRSLVGMARVITGPAWSDLVNQRFVVSWFNRRPIQCRVALGGSGGTTSASAVEFSTALRLEVLTWADAVLDFSFDGYTSNNTAGGTNFTYLTIDGTLYDSYSAFQSTSASATGPVASRLVEPAPSEGYHYVSPFISVNAGTGTWIGSASVGVRCSHKGYIQG